MEGVETHIDDLVQGLREMKNEVFVLTYRPLSVKTRWSIWQKENQLQILRLPWLRGLFNRLSNVPAGEFIYLVPGLFLALPFVLLLYRPDVIHAHGISAGFVGVFWGRIFGIRTIVSTHSIYHFPKSGMYRLVSKWIFRVANYTLCLSNQSVNEIKALGVPDEKVGRFTYWVNLQKFKPLDKKSSKHKLNWDNQFMVLFVGRLVAEKGIPQLLEAAKTFKPEIGLKIGGSGPMESEVQKYYIGRISQEDLPTYYSAADVVIVPSTHDEGFGRVIIESLACGTPVVAANRGAIPEAMNNTVGKLIDISPANIAKTINYLFDNPKELGKLSKLTRKFAIDNYSRTNVNRITKVLEY